MTNSKRIIRRFALLLCTLLIINIFTMNSAFASYQPNPTEFTKTLDNGPVPPEYMGKFKIAIKDPEGNTLKVADDYSTLLNETHENNGNGGNSFLGDFGEIVYLYLRRAQPEAGFHYVTFTVEEIPTDVPGIKFDKTVYNVKCYYKGYEVTQNINHYDTKYIEVNGKYFTYDGQRLELNPDGTVTYIGSRDGFISFNNTTIKYVTHTVKKVWENGSESSAKAQLYKDGTAYGTPVELNAANGWTHTWNNLDDSYSWTVKELDVPAGYTTKTDLSADGKTTTITNTKVKQSANSKSKNTPVKSKRTVKTGDNSNVAAWLVVFATVLISLCFTLYIRKRANSVR